jgi:hypothetical protein
MDSSASTLIRSLRACGGSLAIRVGTASLICLSALAQPLRAEDDFSASPDNMPFDYVQATFKDRSGVEILSVESEPSEKGKSNFFGREEYAFCELRREGFVALRSDRAYTIAPKFIESLIVFLGRAVDDAAHDCDRTDGQSDSTIEAELFGSGRETEPTATPTPVWVDSFRPRGECGGMVGLGVQCQGRCPWGQSCQTQYLTRRECYCPLRNAPDLWPSDSRPVEQHNPNCDEEVACGGGCFLVYPTIVFGLHGEQVEKKVRVGTKCRSINRIVEVTCACAPAETSSPG